MTIAFELAEEPLRVVVVIQADTALFLDGRNKRRRRRGSGGGSSASSTTTTTTTTTTTVLLVLGGLERFQFGGQQHYLPLDLILG